MKRHKISFSSKGDATLFFLVSIITIIGVVAIADTSAPMALKNFNDKFYFAKQQAMWVAAGIVSMLVFSKINYKIWKTYATPIFLASLFLLFVVLIPGIGTKILGARRWINLGFFSLQPSEVVKFSLAIFLAKVADKKMGLKSFFIPLGTVVALTMLQPDLGTTIIISVIALSEIFLSGVNLLHFATTLVVGGFSGLILILTSDYRRDRLLTFIKGTHDPLGTSYHIRQILLALGSGGMFGLGLGHSKQKYLFLPETATDSIFAVLAEELGFVGASIIVAVMFLVVIRALKIAKNAPDNFSKILASGITAWIGGQIFLNIASMVSLVPLTGIPLPFISYGGSALLMLLSSIGILINISKYAKN